MNSSFIYTEIISEIRTACSKHLAGLTSADDVQRIVQRGEIEIIAAEEKDIRDFLTDMEGKLELIKFSVEDNKQLSETQNISKSILSWLANREKSLP